MNSWYAYKVLADSYAADRRREADMHRQARRAGRRGRRMWSRSAVSER